MAGAAEKINHFSGASKTHWLQTISRITHLVNPIDTRAKVVTYPLIAAALILLPQLPNIVFMACDCGENAPKKIKRPPSFHAGQSTETIAFTERAYEAGTMTRDEKIRLDNEAMKNNALAYLNGIETKADEMPDEWEQYK